MDIVCGEATETVNGYSMSEVCDAMFDSPSGAHRGLGPSLDVIFSSAAEAVASAPSPMRTLTQTQGGLASLYVVSYQPGLGCTLIASDGIQNLAVDGYAIATTPFASTPKHDTFTCKFTNPQSILPVPPGLVTELADKNYLFPGTFSAILPLLRCQFNTYNVVDRNQPVDINDPSQGFYGSRTLYLNNPGRGIRAIVLPAGKKMPETLTVTCRADPVSAAEAQIGQGRHLLQETQVIKKTLSNSGYFTVCVNLTSLCFPGAATVETLEGPKTMAELQLGDKVLALSPDGKPFYDTVYLIPHQEAARSAQYLNLHIELIDGSNRTAKLTLSELHHVLVACHSISSGKCEKYAKDAAIGDVVFVMGNAGEEPSRGVVAKITSSTEQGIFSPWTMSGNLIVDGVLASMHSTWPGEDPVMRYLPKRYHPANLNDMAALKQWILTPARGAYHLMVRLSNWLASNNLPSFVPFKYFNKLFTATSRWNLDLQLKNEGAKPHMPTSSAGPEWEVSGSRVGQMEKLVGVVGSSY